MLLMNLKPLNRIKDILKWSKLTSNSRLSYRNLMASYKLFVVFALLAISIPSISAMEHIVGDDIGWTTNFDYQAWAKGKIFFVGDKLSK